MPHERQVAPIEKQLEIRVHYGLTFFFSSLSKFGNWLYCAAEQGDPQLCPENKELFQLKKIIWFKYG
jgi:hypothetical protein